MELRSAPRVTKVSYKQALHLSSLRYEHLHFFLLYQNPESMSNSSPEPIMTDTRAIILHTSGVQVRLRLLKVGFQMHWAALENCRVCTHMLRTVN